MAQQRRRDSGECVLVAWMGAASCERVSMLIKIFDATNTSRERRQIIHDYCTKTYCFRLFWVESVCDDPKVIEANVREVKVSSPDYKNVEAEAAVSDFLERIRLYEMQYEPIDEKLDKHWSFIRIFNVGERFLVNRVIGHIQSRVVYFLMNIRVLPRTIYLTRVRCSTVTLTLPIHSLISPIPFQARRERDELGAAHRRQFAPVHARPPIRRQTRRVHSQREPARFGRVDESVQAHHTDSRTNRGPQGAVEGTQ